MNWIPAVIDGQTYDLSHLHPFSFQLVMEAIKNFPAMTFDIDVHFGLHCFTHEPKPACLPEHSYADAKETRCFCHARYILSLRLPEIIRTLDKKRCYEAKKNNYMTFEIIGANSLPVHYQVYFIVTKSRMPGRLTLFVQSAYEKDTPKKVQREKPLLFKAICFKASK